MNKVVLIVTLLAVFAHGIGHILFLMPALGVAGWGHSASSWLLTGRLGETVTRALAVVIWVLVIAAYMAGIYGFLIHSAWWSQALIGASVLSLIGLILFWANFQPVKAAIVFDLAIILSLQVFHWPPAEMASRAIS